ncbi:MAG: hypothetical protein AB1765_06700 [Candidatus Hydrogenedentota bacterium]
MNISEEITNRKLQKSILLNLPQDTLEKLFNKRLKAVKNLLRLELERRKKSKLFRN